MKNPVTTQEIDYRIDSFLIHPTSQFGSGLKTGGIGQVKTIIRIPQVLCS